MNLSRREFLAGTISVATVSKGGWAVPPKSSDSPMIGSSAYILHLGLYEAIETIRELGFQAIELHPEGRAEPMPHRRPGFHFDRLREAEKQKLRKAVEPFRRVSIHLPFHGLRPFYWRRFPSVAEFSIEQLKIAMEATAFLGAEMAVIHGPTRLSGKDLEQAWPKILRLYREFGDMAAKRKFRLAIETGHPRGGQAGDMPISPPSVSDFVRLIREIDHDEVGCAVDLGHQYLYKEFRAQVNLKKPGRPDDIRIYNDVTHDIIDQLADKVFHFHMGDIDPIYWRDQKPIGAGGVDFPRLIEKLNKIQYKGLLIFELTAPNMRKNLAESKRLLEGFLANH